jgi:Fic family protein
MDLEEYRLLNGWSKDRKKGSTRNDGIPVGLVDEVIIHTPSEYHKLLPENLPENFTSKDYQKASKLRQRDAVTALNILNHVGVVKRVGKKGRAYLYSR